MLTIENITKIVGKTFTPDMNWKVSKVWEEPNRYHFILDRYNNNFKIDYTTKISIVRLHGAEIPHGIDNCNVLLYRFLYEGYDTESWGSKLDFKCMHFVLETFEHLVKRIPK